MRRVLRQLGAAFAFLTLLPLGRGAGRPSDLRGSLSFFPVVGVTLGAVLSLFAWLLVRLLGGRLPADLGAVALAALLAAMTSALHLDGLADLFDGLGGGRGDRARTLEIMRDGRIGAYGAVAVVLALLAKVSALSALLAHRDYDALLAFPVAARWVVVPLIAFFPYARPEGLGRVFRGEGGGRRALMATLLTGALLAWLGLRLVTPALVALGTALALGLWVRRRLGGLTGDVYGAAIEIGEVAFLVATVASLDSA